MSVFDIKRSLELLDDDEQLFKELAAMFRDRAAGVVENVAATVARRDQEAARRAIHALIGNLSSFHADQATTAAVQLQDTVKSQQWPDTEKQVATVRGEVERLCDALQQYIEGR